MPSITLRHVGFKRQKLSANQSALGGPLALFCAMMSGAARKLSRAELSGSWRLTNDAQSNPQSRAAATLTAKRG